MKKKRVGILLCILCCLFQITACRNIQKEEAKKEIPVIRIAISGLPKLTGEYKKVNETLGTISEKKYGFRLQMVPEDTEAGRKFAFYTDVKEAIDIKGLYYNEYKKYAEKELLLDMKPYIKTVGQELQSVLDHKAPQESKWKDYIYGIPKTYSDIHYSGALLSQKYVEKYEMDLDAVHSLENMEKLLYTIKENESIIPWAKAKTTPIAIARSPIGDLLDDMLCMVDYYGGNKIEVKNMYETKEYEKRVRLIRSWYEKGYLQKDILTNREYGQSLLGSGEAFATEIVVRADEMEYMKEMDGNLDPYVIFDKNVYLDSECDWVYIWCISNNTAHPKEAVEALNAVFADQEILTTILYGVEGEHYIVREDGHIEYPKGIDSTTVKYSNHYKWMFNRLNARLWKGVDDDLKQQMEEMKQEAIVSPAYGFWVDQSKLSVNLNKIQAVIDQYRDKLNCGVCDVDEVLPKFRRELKNAGADELVKEVQWQVNQWRKEK